jgi:cohesin complex subunit SCC1
LNVGDDEIIDDEDDAADGFAPGAEGTHLENSGWSSRTRSVYVKLDKNLNVFYLRCSALVTSFPFLYCLTNAFIHRAVAKYLQTLFDKEDLHGRQNLHLENILAGKTRKEASRMFFETLVCS